MSGLEIASGTGVTFWDDYGQVSDVVIQGNISDVSLQVPLREGVVLARMQTLYAREDGGRNIGSVLIATLTSNGHREPYIMQNCFQISPKMRIRWNLIDDERIDIGIEGVVSTDGYMAFGVANPSASKSLMGGSDVAYAGFRGGRPFLVDGYISGYEECNYGVNADDLFGACDDYSWAGGDASASNLEIQYAHQFEGVTFVRYRRKLRTSDYRFDHEITPNKSQNFIWAMGGTHSSWEEEQAAPPTIPSSPTPAPRVYDGGAFDPLNLFGPGSGAAALRGDNPFDGPQMRFHGSVNYGEIHDLLLGGSDRVYSCYTLAGADTDPVVESEGEEAFADTFAESLFLDEFGKIKFYWTLDEASETVRFGLLSKKKVGWLSLALGNEMTGSYAYVGWDGLDNTVTPSFESYILKGLDASQVVISPENVTGAEVFRVDDFLAMSFSRPLKGVEGAPDIDPQNVQLLWAVGASWTRGPLDNVAHYHFDRSGTSIELNLLSGSAQSIGLNSMYIWHGWLMWVSWCALVPVSIFGARHFRNFEGTFWLQFHTYVNYLCAALVMCGTWFAVLLEFELHRPGAFDSNASLHSKLGVAAVILMAVQVLLALMRHRLSKGSAYDADKQASASVMKAFTEEEVAQHNTKESLWTIVDGKVYDITSWQRKHPGGSKVLFKGMAGQDGTQKLLNAPHRDHNEIMSMMDNMFKIGFIGLADSPVPTEEAEPLVDTPNDTPAASPASAGGVSMGAWVLSHKILGMACLGVALSAVYTGLEQSARQGASQAEIEYYLNATVMWWVGLFAIVLVGEAIRTIANKPCFEGKDNPSELLWKRYSHERTLFVLLRL